MDEIQIERRPGSASDVTILTLKGPLTISTLFDFQTAVRQPDVKSAIIDFSGVPYIDSAGLGVVLSHWAHTQRIGAKFAAVAISERVRVLLEMTRVSTLLPMYPSVEEAEKAFSSAATSSTVASV
ncbi:MAG TPA: STAS domain-containing protein [Bryobacteraceae bacterium]|nr:STAS domain-containing protein [Bryobacteraceae bacterium]